MNIAYTSLRFHFKNLNTFLNDGNILGSMFCCLKKKNPKTTNIVLSFQPNSQIATETEVVSSEVSEGRVSENQSHVLLENLHINKVDVLGEKMR